MADRNSTGERSGRRSDDGGSRSGGERSISSDLSRRNVLRVVGGAGVGMGVGVGAFTGVASAHEVSKVVFCECVEVTVYGQLLLGDDEPSDATGDAGYRAVLYCDGDLVRRSLKGTQTRQHYSLLDDPEYDHSECELIAVEGTTWHPDHRGMEFRLCNEHCRWDCAADGLAAQGSDWCDDPSDIPSGGGEGGVDPDRDIVVECLTDCLPPREPQGCTPGYWKQPAYRNNVWTSDDEYGPDTLVRNTFELAVTDGGGNGRRGRGGGNDRDWKSMRLLEALDGGGGPGIEGAQKILIRAAVAALLNAQHDDINYPLSVDEIVDAVNEALASGDRQTILDLADQLDEYNNLGCPLDAFGRVE